MLKNIFMFRNREMKNKFMARIELAKAKLKYTEASFFTSMNEK